MRVLYRHVWLAGEAMAKVLEEKGVLGEEKP
jgi:hypothetical protein